MARLFQQYLSKNLRLCQIKTETSRTKIVVKAVTWAIKAVKPVSKDKTRVATWVPNREPAKPVVEAAVVAAARTETKISSPAAASKIRVVPAKATVNDCSFLNCKQRPEQKALDAVLF